MKNRALQIGDLGYYNHEQSNRVYSEDYASPTIRTKADEAQGIKIFDNQLRIRKLTPRECFRLQGVKDEDYDKLKDLSESTLYHLAGDSICVSVLMAIFGELCDLEWEEKVYKLHE